MILDNQPIQPDPFTRGRVNQHGGVEALVLRFRAPAGLFVPDCVNPIPALAGLLHRPPTNPVAPAARALRVLRHLPDPDAPGRGCHVPATHLEVQGGVTNPNLLVVGGCFQIDLLGSAIAKRHPHLHEEPFGPPPGARDKLGPGDLIQAGQLFLPGPTG